ncbi:MAG TPA: hypothetical protein VF607_08735 [Verrucomicrobiae bacterium]
MGNKWYQQPRHWVELFALFNLGGLAPDIFLAHSTNHFHHRAEWVPLYFSLAAPALLLIGWGAGLKQKNALWHWAGLVVGWGAIVVGVVGLVLHLKSQFFQQWTLASLVYAAPFAAPLAYTGIGLLLLLNRLVDARTQEWAEWVIMLALGGFIGNFIFSVTDHAQNGFFQKIEWIPVGASALAIGTLSVPLFMATGTAYFRFCLAVLLLEALVGLTGFGLHLHADLVAEGGDLFQRVVHGAPILAPMLFPNLALLAAIGLWAFYRPAPVPVPKP